MNSGVSTSLTRSEEGLTIRRPPECNGYPKRPRGEEILHVFPQSPARLSVIGGQ
jgi:hypothetical protein